jgi:hypothetical protein
MHISNAEVVDETFKQQQQQKENAFDATVPHHTPHDALVYAEPQLPIVIYFTRRQKTNTTFVLIFLVNESFLIACTAQYNTEVVSLILKWTCSPSTFAIKLIIFLFI